MNLIMTLYNSH